MYADPYAHAQTLISGFKQRDGETIGNLGRSLVLDHGHRTERAVVLFHGISASPAQFATIANELYTRGHNVFVPRLPQHGRKDRLSPALALLSAEQLRACARDSVAIGRGLGERLSVAGFSLGGLLAAHVAQFERVNRVVAIAPFLGVSLLPAVLMQPLTRWLLRIPNRFYWWNPFLRDRQLPAHGYPRFATHAVAQGLLMAQDLMAAAASTPAAADSIAVLLNTSELTVNNRAAQRLARAWQAHKPDAVEIRKLRALSYVHDFIEPRRYAGAAQRMLPVIVDAILSEG